MRDADSAEQLHNETLQSDLELWSFHRDTACLLGCLRAECHAMCVVTPPSTVDVIV